MVTQNSDIRYRVNVDVVGEEQLFAFQKSVTAMGGQIRQFNQQAGSMNRGAGQLSQSFQNLGFQVQDVFVQIASGQGVMRALAQQVPQAASGFGAWGVAVGTLAAVFATLLPFLIETRDAAEQFEESLEGIDSSVASLRSAIDQATQPLRNLREEFGSLSGVAETVFGTGLKNAVLDLKSTLAQAQKDLDAQFNFQRLIADYDALAAAHERVREQYDRGLATDKQRQDSLNTLIFFMENLEAQTGMTAAQSRELDRILTGMVNEIGQGKISGEFGAAAVALRASLQAAGEIPPEITKVLNLIIQTEARALNVTDALSDAGDEAGGLSTSLRDAAGEMAILRGLADQTAQALSRIGTAGRTLAEDTAYAQAKLDAINAGATQARAESLAKIDQQRRALADQLNSTEPMVSEAARRELALFTSEVLANERANSDLDAAVKALNASLSGNTEGKGTSGGTAKAAQTAKEAMEALMQSLAAYQTPAEQAAAAHAELQRQFREAGGLKAGTAEMALYERALQELAQTASEVTVELTDVGNIIASNMTGAFDSIIDGSQSAGDAFADMLEQMLRDIARFLLSQAVTQFLQSFAGVPGCGTVTTATPSAPGFTPTVGLSAAPAAFAFSAPTISAQTFGSRMAVPTVTSSAYRATNTDAPVSVTVNNNNGSEIEVQERQSTNGMREVEVFVENKVKNLLSSGKMDRTMKQNYGLRRSV